MAGSLSAAGKAGKQFTARGKSAVFSLALSLIIILSLAAASCERGPASRQDSRKIRIVTTLFPLYDFSRSIGGKFAEVTLLLPPGTEAHSFEPRPADMARINSADFFIYTTPPMEPWVPGLLKGTDSPRLSVIEAGRGMQAAAHHHGTHEDDPHIWLDFSNAVRMCETIAAELSARDPANRDYYRGNADLYINRLKALDEKYRESLKNCRRRVIVHAGHSAFGYLAKRYDLKQITAFKGFSPDAEPTPRALAALSRTVREEGLRYIFIEELIIPRIGEAISKETGAELLLLHGAHNLSKSEMDSGTTFLHLMEKNLENLRKGLQCQ